MLREVIQWMDLQAGLVVVDGTVGAAGHSQHILKRIGPTGTLIGLDRDPLMLGHAGNVLNAENCHLRHSSYADLLDILADLQIESVDRILLDLGLSSDQLEDRTRGFGFQVGGELDLRFDTSIGRPASQFLRDSTADEVADVLERYGEERFSRKIAEEIAGRDDIRTAENLVEAIQHAIPARHLKAARKHPATRVFQALRIAVNEELRHLERALEETLPAALKPGGRLCIITFHSLEDRLVKQIFRESDQWQDLTAKPVTATPNEQRINPRSRSAKLRAAEKI